MEDTPTDQAVPPKPPSYSLAVNTALGAIWSSATRTIARLRPVRRPDRAWFWFSLGFAVVLTGLLIGPRIPDDSQRDSCVGNIRLPGPFGIHLNCDAPEFLELASDPTGLFKAKNYRQSRPGLILFAAALNVPLSLFAKTVADTTPPQDDPERIIDSYSRYFPAYLAYMLLNGGILLLSFHFLRKTIECSSFDERTATPILVSVGLLLVTNDVTKAFFWSPHTQMFNILVPVMAVYAGVRIWGGALSHRRFATGLGLFVGFGLTAYGAFAIILGVVTIMAALPRTRATKSGTAVAINWFLILVLSALPTLFWYFTVRAVTNDFFSAEINEEAFVWMLRSWDNGFSVLLTEWFSKFAWMLRYAAPQALPLLVLALFILWQAWQNPVAARKAMSDASPSVGAGLLVSVAVLVFYTCVGWIFWRLAFPIIPPLLVATGAVAVSFAHTLGRERGMILARGISIIAAANWIYVVAKDGPFS